MHKDVWTWYGENGAEENFVGVLNTFHIVRLFHSLLRTEAARGDCGAGMICHTCLTGVFKDNEPPA